MSLKLGLRHTGDVAVIDVGGRITIGEEAVAFRDAVQKLGKSNPAKVLLNLAELAYVDSSGTGELVAAYSLIANQGGQLKLVNVGKRIRDVFRIAQLTPLFQIYEDEAAAIQSFR